MEILIGWLEENYAAYLRSNQKSALINGLRDKIATAGFPRCAARELREQISSLETPPWSPFLKLYSHRLDAIYGVRVKREPDAATNEPRAARKTHQDINETRETQRNNKVTPRDSRDDSPIKIEPCFPDGSANAPLVVYGDGDENSREFSNEPTLEEIPDVRRWWMHDSSTARTRERCLKTNLTCPSPCPRFKYSRKKCWVRTP
ncbi:hypothetical protein JG688_00001779 [Phytophthora aleatoria]|uniref:Uncharacterized protein n=1 Tax=Phytophthora aleatoria TaxID=2496075 RepID=A0A8J5JCU8_9STRA|nr:hypothetical protein JG688_00001779 [Phytophthora aleatoria]